VDVNKGLSGADFVARGEFFGSNWRDEIKAKSFCKIYFEALDDFMLKVLIVAATGSLIFEYIGADPEDYGHGKYHLYEPGLQPGLQFCRRARPAAGSVSAGVLVRRQTRSVLAENKINYNLWLLQRGLMERPFTLPCWLFRAFLLSSTGARKRSSPCARGKTPPTNL